MVQIVDSRQMSRESDRELLHGAALAMERATGFSRFNLMGIDGLWRSSGAHLFSYGLSPKRAVHDLVQAHLRYGEAKGKGSRARRRMAKLFASPGRF